MNNIQFAFALIGGIGAFLAASWIISQAIRQTASNPVYDLQFEHGKETMDELKMDIKELNDCISHLDKKIEDMPKKFVELLRNLK